MLVSNILLRYCSQKALYLFCIVSKLSILKFISCILSCTFSLKINSVNVVLKPENTFHVSAYLQIFERLDSLIDKNIKYARYVRT